MCTDLGFLSRWREQLTGTFQLEAGGRVLQTAANARVSRQGESSGKSLGLRRTCARTARVRGWKSLPSGTLPDSEADESALKPIPVVTW